MIIIYAYLAILFKKWLASFLRENFTNVHKAGKLKYVGKMKKNLKEKLSKKLRPINK